jgi:YfiH family protein
LRRDPSGIATFPDFDVVPGVAHGYADALALGGFDAARDPDRRRLRDVVLPGATLACTRQTHSPRLARVVVRDRVATFEPVFAGAAGETGADSGIDGLVTTERGVLLHAVSADCPLLLVASRDGRVVGVAHCGWRGIARGIVAATLEAMDAAGAAGSECVAAVTPGARGCCYEVGDEVVEGLATAGAPRAAFLAGENANGRARVDLLAAIAALLAPARVAIATGLAAAACTICGGERFHSYRRSASRGRMAAVIGLRAV